MIATTESAYFFYNHLGSKLYSAQLLVKIMYHESPDLSNIFLKKDENLVSISKVPQIYIIPKPNTIKRMSKTKIYS